MPSFAQIDPELLKVIPSTGVAGALILLVAVLSTILGKHGVTLLKTISDDFIASFERIHTADREQNALFLRSTEKSQQLFQDQIEALSTRATLAQDHFQAQLKSLTDDHTKTTSENTRAVRELEIAIRSYLHASTPADPAKTNHQTTSDH